MWVVKVVLDLPPDFDNSPSKETAADLAAICDRLAELTKPMWQEPGSNIGQRVRKLEVLEEK